MAYNTQKMLKDANGQYIPQIYDPNTDSFIPLTVDAYNNINVSNFPTEQSVTGTVGVSNFPATQDVQLTGSSMEYYGATVTERPAIADVPTGAVYMAVDTQEMWQSNGTSWVVI